MSTKHAYEYCHDGGIYIGCKAQGEHWDCKEYDMWKVDCLTCEYRKQERNNMGAVRTYDY